MQLGTYFVKIFRHKIYHRFVSETCLNSSCLKIMAEAATKAPVNRREGRNIKIHRTTLPEQEVDTVINHVLVALENPDHKMEKDFATYVKKKCDSELAGTWHVVAGRNFGCSITHDTKHVLFFQVDQMHFLVFKSLD